MPETINVDPDTGEVIGTEATTALSVQALAASLDVQVTTAKQYPRSVETFRSELVSWACLDIEVADSCTYSVPRGGKSIMGASIRFAELAMQAYGNIVVETAVLDDGSENRRHVICVGTCRDLQRNTASRAEVTRSILNKNGSVYQDHMIETTIAAASAIARRNAILQVIPKALWKNAHDKSKKVMIGEGKPHSERVADAKAALVKLGANEGDVEAWVGHRWEDMTIDDLVALRLRYKAIDEKAVRVEDAFPTPGTPAENGDATRAEKPGAVAAASALSKARERRQEKPEPETDPDTGEVIPPEIK